MRRKKRQEICTCYLIGNGRAGGASVNMRRHDACFDAHITPTFALFPRSTRMGRHRFQLIIPKSRRLSMDHQRDNGTTTEAADRLRTTMTLYFRHQSAEQRPADESGARGMASQSRSFANGVPTIASHRRRATAIPSRNAISSDPNGASRARLLRRLRGIPGFLPVSIASLTVCATDFTASETSATVDLGSDAGSGLSLCKVKAPGCHRSW